MQGSDQNPPHSLVSDSEIVSSFARVHAVPFLDQANLDELVEAGVELAALEARQGGSSNKFWVSGW